MIDAIVKGVAIGLVLIFSVGPVILTVVKQSINNGRAGGFSFISGVWLSDLLWIVLSNAFSELMTTLLNFKKTIGFAGGSLLLAMGIYYLFFKKIHLKEDEDKIKISAGTHARLMASGFLLNTLNPAVITFWLTTATTIALTNTVRERIVIFSTCILLNISADILKVILAGKLRSKLNEKNISLLNKGMGLLLAGFGIVILLGVLYVAFNKS
jgi:threonine/homoserine/homoserine lactone efflux protein